MFGYTGPAFFFTWISLASNVFGVYLDRNRQLCQGELTFKLARYEDPKFAAYMHVSTSSMEQCAHTCFEKLIFCFAARWDPDQKTCSVSYKSYSCVSDQLEVLQPSAKLTEPIMLYCLKCVGDVEVVENSKKGTGILTNPFVALRPVATTSTTTSPNTRVASSTRSSSKRLTTLRTTTTLSTINVTSTTSSSSKRLATLRTFPTPVRLQFRSETTTLKPSLSTSTPAYASESTLSSAETEFESENNTMSTLGLSRNFSVIYSEGITPNTPTSVVHAAIPDDTVPVVIRVSARQLLNTAIATTTTVPTTVITTTKKSIQENEFGGEQDSVQRLVLETLDYSSPQQPPKRLQKLSQPHGNCSEDILVPCSYGIGRGCGIAQLRDGCLACVCPFNSPAIGCLGALFINSTKRINLLEGRDTCPNSHLLARTVERYYRKIDDAVGFDNCVVSKEPFCGFRQEANLYRMPLSKQECIYYCYSESEARQRKFFV